MPSEGIQRRIDRLLDEAEEAADDQDWSTVQRLADEVLGLDGGNEDAPALLGAAERRIATGSVSTPPNRSDAAAGELSAGPTPDPSSFAGGRYVVQRFLGEGGKKRVYLAPRR